MSRIVICPTFDAFYYSFYLQALTEVFGRSSIRFSSRPFPRLPAGLLAFIVREPRELRVVIDAYDGSRIIKPHIPGLEWCDIYGKVNLTLADVPEDQAHKCLPMGPSFPVRLWSPVESWWLAVKNYRVSLNFHSLRERLNETREHFANYRRQYKYRLPVRELVPGKARDDYIFFSATLWNEEQTSGTNLYRALFIQSCKSHPGVTFEGGLVPSSSWSSDNLNRYADCIRPKHVPFPEWLEKTKASAVVFNTPAVWSSHAWKLPEFLALGKAIISTPLARELPAPLVHGQHIHFVDGSLESIRAAVLLILNDRDYRHHLERNAHDYYLRFLTPNRVIERLISLS
jgi:hypothetical protein